MVEVQEATWLISLRAPAEIGADSAASSDIAVTKREGRVVRNAYFMDVSGCGLRRIQASIL
jgi:hypothetical protein